MNRFLLRQIVARCDTRPLSAECIVKLLIMNTFYCYAVSRQEWMAIVTPTRDVQHTTKVSPKAKMMMQDKTESIFLINVSHGFLSIFCIVVEWL